MYPIDNGQYWTDDSRLMSNMWLNILREDYPDLTDQEIFDKESIRRYRV